MNLFLMDHLMIIFCFLQNLDQSASASNDYLTHQNLKFLFYHFNNYFNRHSASNF